MAASASVMLPGSIFSISLRASAVRFAWAIKPTIRWPLSYQAQAGARVSKWNTKNVERKVAVNGASEVGIINLYADEVGLSRSTVVIHFQSTMTLKIEKDSSLCSE